VEKTRIIEILSEWNPWNGALEAGFERQDYLQKLEKLHATGQIVTMAGVRRSGKSTIMKQYINRLAKKSGADSILYVNFEEPFFANPNLDLLLNIYDAYKETINPSARSYVFLDEVQKVAGWERFARGLHEKGVADVFVSGSTGSLISSDYGALLTGRHIDMRVFPFSFGEFLAVRGIEGGKAALLDRYRTASLLTEYLTWGGFPKAVLTEEKKPILATCLEDIIGKDVISRYGVREAGKLRELAAYYLSNVSAPHSFNKIAGFLHLSVDTVDRFSGYFADAYLFYFIRRFSYSLKEQSVNPRKVYCADTGLREAAAFKFSSDSGRVMENAVALHLLRSGREVYYWKQKKSEYEVDFVVKEGNDITEALQVSHGTKNPREERALKAVEKELNPKKLTVIGWDEPETSYDGSQLWKWLLGL
jgi:predicted AAA+ superfamily ATPase